MTSKEMEARSGVPRANIRYYESEGLLTPARAGNGYRDYSEADLAVLEKIKLLRRLGVSVEELKELRRGSRSLSEALDRRLAELAGERGTLERVEQVCGDLRRSGESFETLDPRTYLSALDAPALPPADGQVWWKAPPAPALPETDALPVYTGLTRRLLARLFDEYGLLLLLLAAAALMGHNPALASGLALQTAVHVIWLFLEPLLLYLFGATPGKALLGLRITGRDGEKLTYSEGFTRHLLLLWYGRGAFIPIWSWIQMFRTANRCWNDEPQPWDTDTAYTAAPFRPLRHAAGFVLASVLVLACAEAANSYSQLPPNRGPLTVAEFAENYNRQAAYIDQSPVWILDETGGWKRAPDPPGVTVTYTGASWRRDHDFQYTLEDGAVRAVTWERSLENTEEWIYLPVNDIATAATALAWSRADAPLWASARKDLISGLVDADWENGFTLRGNGAVVTWEVESRNFYVNGDLATAFPTDEAKADNSLSWRCTIALEG